MHVNPADKYRPFAPIALPDRTWPSAVITEPPFWCAVDLRDGNQALVEPMGINRKERLFRLLVDMGFKEIEVGFPAASQTDYDFLRHLVTRNLIPDDVTIQVLTQSREPLIRRTFEAIEGVPRAIVHLYNSTSTVQREVVFNMDRQGIIDLAVSGTRLVRELADAAGPGVRFQYSPESFTGTELDYAVEICQAVMDTWKPTAEDRIILNLPATVEMATPNVYADQIEWFCRHLPNRAHAIISVHPHNDRGTAVAAAELAVMAGAQRVEGTLFGNGERTGNVDLITLGLNLFTQGVDPGLRFTDMPRIVETAEDCTRMAVPPRHPYAGELVFTAFSGSHQDAINKGLKAVRASNAGIWQVPYLPIDPMDVGRSYEAVIRVNSQSGKGGVAHVLERDYGLQLPRSLQIHVARVVQKVTDQRETELSAAEIYDLFRATYEDGPAGVAGWHLVEYRTEPESGENTRHLTALLARDGEEIQVAAKGNGPIDAFTHAVRDHFGLDFEFANYHEHAVGAGADAHAVSYIEVHDAEGQPHFGVGRHSNIVQASLNGVLAAVNTLLARRDG